ncbi:hypothetical protein AMC90_CH02021 [Rhizobium phaseoli]|nr:hypothetical protein AMC90_CH02021 [Rhizobium phaseoli]
MRLNDDFTRPTVVHAAKLDWVASPARGAGCFIASARKWLGRPRLSAMPQAAYFHLIPTRAVKKYWCSTGYSRTNTVASRPDHTSAIRRGRRMRPHPLTGAPSSSSSGSFARATRRKSCADRVKESLEFRTMPSPQRSCSMTVMSRSIFKGGVATPQPNFRIIVDWNCWFLKVSCPLERSDFDPRAGCGCLKAKTCWRAPVQRVHMPGSKTLRCSTPMF